MGVVHLGPEEGRSADRKPWRAKAGAAGRPGDSEENGRHILEGKLDNGCKFGLRDWESRCRVGAAGDAIAAVMRRCGSSTARRTAPVTTIFCYGLRGLAGIAGSHYPPRERECRIVVAGYPCLCHLHVVWIENAGEKSAARASRSEQPSRNFATSPSWVKLHRIYAHSVIAVHVLKVFASVSIHISSLLCFQDVGCN